MVSSNPQVARSSTKVFIVHGHAGEQREAVARFLERLGMEPVILHEQANQGKTLIEKFEAHADVALQRVSRGGGDSESHAAKTDEGGLGYDWATLPSRSRSGLLWSATTWLYIPT
jgi:Predicted nucleotide-binding protein containing TIR-like domain